jgi:DHA1 family bicyclomycin/chloramphenicol resistance-like MFS transporter
MVIGAVSALGPIAIDMYLPGLPTIARDLHAGPGRAEFSLMSFFVGMTLGQLVYGPLSDRIGRRKPLLFGLLLYVVGSLACSVSPNLDVLILARLFQGLGGGAGQAISSAVIRDLYSGYEAARLQASRLLVIAVSPILAPIAGAAVISAVSWRWIFWISAGLGLAGVALVAALLPETRSLEARKQTRLSASLAIYRRLLADSGFLCLVLVAGLTQGAFLAYLAGSSFVFISLNRTPPALYSLIFAVNAAGFIGLAQVAPQLMRRFGGEPVILAGMGLLAAGSLLLLVAALTGHATVPVLAPPLFFGIAGIGLVLGPAIILALKEHGAVAGAASALIGFMQGGIGACGAALVAVFANGAATPMTGTMAAFAVSGLAIAILVYRRRSRSLQPFVEEG